MEITATEFPLTKSDKQDQDFLSGNSGAWLVGYQDCSRQYSFIRKKLPDLMRSFFAHPSRHFVATGLALRSHYFPGELTVCGVVIAEWIPSPENLPKQAMGKRRDSLRCKRFQQLSLLAPKTIARMTTKFITLENTMKLSKTSK